MCVRDVNMMKDVCVEKPPEWDRSMQNSQLK